MKFPETPQNEEERQEALESYEILDTEMEESFDALTRLAAHLLNVPIALISLVDKDRQWFKSKHGFDETEAPRDVSFCGHVVASGDFLWVPNASEDPRFDDNPNSPYGQFYIGMPLTTSEGHVLGTLCAIDKVPRKVSEEQKAMLGLLARQVMAQLELRKSARLLRRQSTELAEQSRDFRAAFASMSEGIIKHDRHHKIVACNPAAERILGLSLDQMIGKTSADIGWHCVHEDGSVLTSDEYPSMQALTEGKPYRDMIVGVQKQGTLTWMSINSVPILDRGIAQGAVTSFRDVTEERSRQAEREMLQNQIAGRERLITAGTLAEGLAHEVKNPLTYILANIDFVLEYFKKHKPLDDDVIPALRDAQDGAIIIRDVVGSLQIFAREEVCIRATDPSKVIKMAIDLAAHEMKLTCQWSFIEGTSSPVIADDSLLAQVLVNLLVNAAHSFQEMNRANSITISTQDVEGEVIIKVQDNGSGIAPDILAHIFDPFFTTRLVGYGAGLGLSVARGIMTSFGGEITCESTLGVGSTFCVVLQVASHSSLFEEETFADEEL